VIEAFPEMPPDTDVEGIVMRRESTTVTALGKGWACPHARVPFDEDLKCVIGWSPSGIEYGAPDGRPVNLVIMYLVPENQRNHYLREISMLAKAIETYHDINRLYDAKSLNDIRNYMLDLIDTTKETVGPDIRARMIRLQARPAQESIAFKDLSNLVMEAVTIIAGPKMKHIILTQNPDLADMLNRASGDLIEKMEADGFYQAGGWRILRRSSTAYQGGMAALECLAVRLATNLGQTR